MLKERLSCTIRTLKPWYCGNIVHCPVGKRATHACQNENHLKTCCGPTKHFSSHGPTNIFETRNSRSMTRARFLRRSTIYLKLNWLYRNFWTRKPMRWQGIKGTHVGWHGFPLWLDAFEGFVKSSQHNIFRISGTPYHLILRRGGLRWIFQHVFERTCNALWLGSWLDEMWPSLTIRQICKL